MIRVLLADDENLIRDALATLLGLEEDLEVVAVAASGTEAVVSNPRLSGTKCGVKLTRTGLPASPDSSCSISGVWRCEASP